MVHRSAHRRRRGVMTARYRPGHRQAVIEADAGGNERSQLWLLDLDAPVARGRSQLLALTDDPGAVHHLPGSSVRAGPPRCCPTRGTPSVSTSACSTPTPARSGCSTTVRAGASLRPAFPRTDAGCRLIFNLVDPDRPTVAQIGRAVGALLGHEPVEVLLPGSLRAGAHLRRAARRRRHPAVAGHCRQELVPRLPTFARIGDTPGRPPALRS